MTTVLYFFTILLAAAQLHCIEGKKELENEPAKALCDFAIELLKVASKKGENTIISPGSVSMILSVVQQGAEGNTAAEIDALLGANADTSKALYANLTRKFKQEPEGVNLQWGNKAYLKHGFTVNEKFQKDIEEDFKTQLEEMNFMNASSQDVADIINSWIREATHDQIMNMIKPHMIRPDMIMLLVNIIYFKGIWRNRFKEINTKTDIFEKTPLETVTASFMYQKSKFYSGKNNKLGVKWIELPFQGNTHKMIFTLPLKKHTLDKVMEKITGEDLMNIINYGYVTEVNLKLPKFKLRRTYSLVEILKQLGLRDVFTEASNLRGISPEPIHLSDAFHQANVEIDEKGSTASAATIMTVARRLISTDIFRFDQPFLFFIIDTANQIPLFAGKITNPTAAD